MEVIRSMLGAGATNARSVLLSLTLTGCEGLGEYRSEHAVIRTDQVDRVCAGTLARIDSTLEYVDQSLGRETDDDLARIYVVTGPDIVEHCEGNYAGCVSGRDVFIATRFFEEVLAHELVHERVGRIVGRWSKPLFNEGIASAIGGAESAPAIDAPRSALDAYVSADSGAELLKLHHGYYHAGELSHWLIGAHGMPAVLAFMAELDSEDSGSKVKATYTRHFGRDIEEDMFAYAREDSELTRANLVCTGAELARDSEQLRFRLEADLGCDSPRVENHWIFYDRVFVEWVIEIDEETRGPWAPVRFAGDTAIPDDTLLEVVPCRRPPHVRHRWTPSRNPAVFLDPGLHRIRWYGPMDGDTKLDIELGGPCDQGAWDCKPDELCINPGVCVPKP